MSKTSKWSYLIALFYRPGNSIKQLIRFDYGHTEALIVAVFFGLIQSSRLLRSTSEELLFHFLIGGLLGLGALYLLGWLVRNFGRWFGASAEQRAVRIALGLGIVPWMFLFMAFALRFALSFCDSPNS